MEITIVQAVLIGLWTGVCLSGMLLGIYTNRCLIMATGVGLILGDLPTGLAMGAVGELAFMGFGVSQGGSVPPNPMGPEKLYAPHFRYKFWTKSPAFAPKDTLLQGSA